VRRLFRGRLEPVDLARRLARALDDNRRITWDRPLVPNRFQIALAPADFADMQGYTVSLQRELARFATERAGERGYAMLAPAAVTIAADPSLQPGNFQVRAALVEDRLDGPAPQAANAPDDFGTTRAMRPLEMPEGPTGIEPLYLVGELDDRRLSWPLAGARLTIGRGIDNDIVLEDASVSRHHAEITREGGRTHIRDLASTNGTWVNAGRVTVAVLQPGDQVAFGAVHLDVTRRPSE
jgi:hypothetical protein